MADVYLLESDENFYDSLSKFLKFHNINTCSTPCSDDSTKTVDHPIIIADRTIYVRVDESSKKLWGLNKTDEKSLRSPFAALGTCPEGLSKVEKTKVLSRLHSISTGVPLALASKQINAFLDSFSNAVFSYQGGENFGNYPIENFELPLCDSNVLRALEKYVLPNHKLIPHFNFKGNFSSAELALLISILQSLKGPCYDIDFKICGEGFFYSSIVVIFEDSDIYTCVENIIELTLSTPRKALKIDLWIQQSIKNSFMARFHQQVKDLPEENKLIFAEIDNTRIPNPHLDSTKILTPPECKAYFFRKNDELKMNLLKYSSIDRLNLWTENISRAISFTRGFSNCTNFLLNSFPQSVPLLDPYLPPMTHCSFYNTLCQTIANLEAPSLEKRDILKLKENSESFYALPFSERISLLIKCLGTELVGKIKHMLNDQKVFQENFQYIILTRTVPIGAVLITLTDDDLQMGEKEIFSMIGRLVLQGNGVCILVPEKLLIKSLQDDFNVLQKFIPFTWTTKKYPFIGFIEDFGKTIGVHTSFSNVSKLVDTFYGFPNLVARTFLPVVDAINYA